MRDPLTPAGPPAPVLRAQAPWQLFEKHRVMPLYEGRVFAEWTTIEGPAPVRRGGRYFCGYSGGNYTGAYGTGEAVADSPLGPYRDLRGREGPLFGTTPGSSKAPAISPSSAPTWSTTGSCCTAAPPARTSGGSGSARPRGRPRG